MWRNRSLEVMATFAFLAYNPIEPITFSAEDSVSPSDIKFLISSVWPHRVSAAQRVRDTWYMCVLPPYPSVSTACRSHTLLPDMCLFWQYGERVSTRSG